MAIKGTLGIERRVSTFVPHDQNSPSIAVLADGGWLVTWSSYEQTGGDAEDIFQQRFDADGAAVGKETTVNTYTTAAQEHSSVTALSDGGWVVTWHSWAQDQGGGYGAYQQRYNAAGETVGDEIRINSTTSDSQRNTDVTALSDGGWVVSWSNSNAVGADSDLYQKRYDASGNIVGSENRVNSTTTGNQSDAEIATLADGGWIVTFESWQSTDGSIYQRRYNAAGTAVATESRVNTFTTGRQESSDVAALGDGGWIVTWESEDQENNGYEIYQQRYEADGDKAGGETRVNTYTTSDQQSSGVTGLKDGGWIVTWQSQSQDGDSWGTYFQRYDAAGNAVGLETRLAVATKYYQYEAKLDALENGGWIVTFASGDKNGLGVYQREFNADGIAVNVGTTKADALKGVGGDDVIRGLLGNDKLYGLAGADVINGGKGADKMYGAAGADTFLLLNGDSGTTKAKADTIYDFKPSSGDIIDLKGWDANASLEGHQDFLFIGNQAFHGVAGELRAVRERSDTWISGDADGDKKVDFMIHLDDAVTMQAEYFLGVTNPDI